MTEDKERYHKKGPGEGQEGQGRAKWDKGRPGGTRKGQGGQGRARKEDKLPRGPEVPP
jgi:hypothetical protein